MKACCNPRDRKETLTPTHIRQVDMVRTPVVVSQPSITTSEDEKVRLLMRISDLEDQFADLRKQLHPILSTNACVESHLPGALSELQQPAPPNSLPRAETGSTQSTEVTEHIKMKFIDFLEGVLSDWDKQMNETKSSLEQAVSLLRERVEQAISRITDLKTLSTTQSTSLEARIVDLEKACVEHQAVVSTAQASCIVPPLQENQKLIDFVPNDLDKESAKEAVALTRIESNVVVAGDDAIRVEVADKDKKKTGIVVKSLSRESLSERESFAAVDPTYTFEESIWDAFLFAGEPEVGGLGSLTIWILFIINIFLLVSFCIVCSISLIHNRFDDETIRGLNDFRTFTSHDQRYKDSITGVSLAARLCQRDDAAKNYFATREHYATTQIDAISVIDEYLGANSDDMFSFRGQLMCLIALVCWVLTAAREAKKTWHFHIGMASLDVTPRSSLSKTEDNKGRASISILSLGQGQYAKYIFIILMRWGICLFMLGVGCVWLSYTVGVVDLLLNAVALEFVLSIDELVFAAGVPRQTKVFIWSLAPVKEKDWVFFHGVDKLSVSVLILTPSITVAFYYIFVVHVVNQMVLAKEALCGNDLNFVFGLDVTGFVWFQNASIEASLTTPLELAQEATLSNRIRQKSLEVGMELPFLWLHTAEAVEKLNRDELVRTNVGCQDILMGFDDNNSHTFGTSHISWFRKQLQNTSISSCADLRAMGFCAKYGNNGWQTRWLCSDTCECNSPIGISPFPHASSGCPEACALSSEHAQKLHTIGCVDMTLEALQSSNYWEGWAAYMRDTLSAIHSYNYVSSLYVEMTSRGCDFVATSSQKEELCSGSSLMHIRPLAPICPITCGCKTVWLEQCPQTCLEQYLSLNSTS